jgi:chemotaxis protein histidine kinase CheA
VQTDQFHSRIDAVRLRFASSLESKIQDTYAQLPSLTGQSADVLDAVEASYRRIHAICGVGGAVGFVGTGRAAKVVEDVLIAPYRGRRGLDSDELVRLEHSLAVLSAVAATELATLGAPVASSAQR